MKLKVNEKSDASLEKIKTHCVGIVVSTDQIDIITVALRKHFMLLKLRYKNSSGMDDLPNGSRDEYCYKICTAG